MYMTKTIDRDKVEALIGYRPFTTFYDDFSIADLYGKKAIQETFDLAMNEWKDNYKYLTEFVMMLNWKICEHEKTNREYAKLYNRLWEIADEYALDHLERDELDYFYSVTD